VASEPKDILGLVRALRRDLAGPIGRHEGAVHALVHRLLRQGTLEAGGLSPQGLMLYRAEGAPEPAATHAEPPSSSPDASIARDALRVAGAVRDPAARGRVLADVRAHLEELTAADTRQRFGRPKAWRAILQRVDRGKPAVIVSAGAGDLMRRMLLHEGPWILGAVAVFFILKLFVVSPFKIPSESMLPTLEKGDRVAVFTLFHDGVPDRFDVMVYKRDGINYVKRLVGLPGESIALWHGDVYINDTLLVKPDWLVEALRSTVGDWRFDEVTPAGFASMKRDGVERWWWRSGRFDAHPRGHVSFGMHDGMAVVRGQRRTGQVLEVSLAHGPAGTRAVGNGWVLRCNDEGVRLLARRGMDLLSGADGETEVELGRLATAPQGEVQLELSYVDGVLRARCGAFTYEGAQVSPSGDLSVGVGRSDGATGALTLALSRDHHYSSPPEAGHGTPVQGQRRGHLVPADRVFCLGDNTTNSRDSRYSPVGDIPVDSIVGPVSVRIWPPSRWGAVK